MIQTSVETGPAGQWPARYIERTRKRRQIQPAATGRPYDVDGPPMAAPSASRAGRGRDTGEHLVTSAVVDVPLLALTAAPYRRTGH